MSSTKRTFESLLEAVPDALVGMDQKGVIQFVNRHTESLFGYDRDQLIGQPIETLVSETLWQIYAEHRDDYFADPRTRSSGLDLELSGRQADGTEFPINISLSHIDSGDVLLVITAALDVTQRKQAIKKAQLTAAIVQYSDDAIIGSTLAGVITSWNPAAEEMYGYSAKEIIGKSGSLLTPEDQAGLVDAILARVKAGEVVEHLELNHVRKDGTVLPVSVTVAPIRDEDGAVVGVSGVHRNMTEQEHAALYARSLIEASLDPLVTISPGGIITDVNEATVTVLGVPRDQLIGTPIHLYHTEPEKTDEIYQQVVTQGSLADYPLTLRHRDGTLTNILCNLSAYRDIGGNVIGVLATGRDVTKQVKAQREIAEQQAEVLERLEQLQRFQRLAVGRELKMIELKKEIESLRRLVQMDQGEHGAQD